MQLIIDAALPHLKAKLTGFEARLTPPLWVGDCLTAQGGAAQGGRMSCPGVDKDRYRCAAVDLEQAE